MLTKLGRDEVLMARHMHKDLLAIYAQEADPGRGKKGHRGGGGVPFFKKLNLLQTGRLQQQTKFIAMI